MDEILPRRSESGKPAYQVVSTAPSKAQPRSGYDKLHKAVSTVLDGGERVRRRGSRVFHWVDRAVAGKRLMPPLLFLLAAGLLGAWLTVATVYTHNYVVAVDGVELGTVSDPGVFETIMTRVENRASGILGYSYTLPQTVTYEKEMVKRGTESSTVGFEDYLFDSIGAIMQGYTLMVNGEQMAVAADQATLTSMLDSIKAPYVNENTTSADFVEAVSIGHKYLPADSQSNMDEVLATLTANTTGQTVYEVQKGDTFSEIANNNGMYTKELAALNPDVDINKLMIGQLVNIKEEIPFLSVMTSERQVYEESIAPPVQEVEDASMYRGDSKVLEAGAAGSAQVTADVTFINGAEKGRDVIETVTLSEPTTKVIAIGTKERPSWLPNGYFIWPVYGNITSGFGYRYIFGSTSYHSGIDIAVPYGTSVKAADGGTVIWSGTGTGSSWSYGKYVIIDHGNGKQTYYAHNSSLLVSAGDHVYQGQVIAKAGSTGRSTGSHCHFQVKINGSDVNPRSYLP